MRTRIIKEAEFDFSEEKYTAIPNSVFSMLIGEPEDYLDSNPPSPKIIMFENKEDYIHNALRHNIDSSKNYYVSNKGQILCFLKDEGTTDTEENKGE